MLALVQLSVQAIVQDSVQASGQTPVQAPFRLLRRLLCHPVQPCAGRAKLHETQVAIHSYVVGRVEVRAGMLRTSLVFLRDDVSLSGSLYSALFRGLRRACAGLVQSRDEHGHNRRIRQPSSGVVSRRYSP